MPYVSEATLRSALGQLYGSAGHFLKVFLVLKHMGLGIGRDPVVVDTANSTPSLERLFGFWDADGRFFVPFAHTKRYSTIHGHAARSIVQTNVQRWATSGSVVTCYLSGYLDFAHNGDDVQVSPGRNYPVGLGHGESGFALEEGQRTALPLLAFAAWYGRREELPDGVDPAEFLVASLTNDLYLTPAEVELLFVPTALSETQAAPISEAALAALCAPFIEGSTSATATIAREDFLQYNRRLRTMASNLDLPPWLRIDPAIQLTELLDQGAKAVLLYGPPRTGKSRAIDMVCARDSPGRQTIQIHEGWGYDHLIQGFMPDAGGLWFWKTGALLGSDS